jgi:pyruvate dehydrogenase E1 component beta subunit
LERDPRLLVFGIDVGKNGGVFRVTDGLQERFGEKRVLDTPLAESATVGTAIGMAMYGLHPVAEIQFAGFSYLAFNQIVSQAARMRTRSGGVSPGHSRSFGGGVRTQNPPAMWALYMLQIKVVIPNPYDAGAASRGHCRRTQCCFTGT